TFGGVVGRQDIARELLDEGRLALVCPGGIYDACKPFYERYFVRSVGGFSPEHCGYVKTAYYAGKPIIPIAVVGAEETLLTLADAKPLVLGIMKRLDKMFGLRKSPRLGELYRLVDFARVVPLVMNLFPFPSKVDAYAGKPIDVREMLGTRPSQKDFAYVNSAVMSRLQGLIDKGLAKSHGLTRISGMLKDIIEVC
ncbi:MAG: hypothetical protein QME12_05715, partial [Nanoarchaeota archaeon]|nr:hypothetical protein [Nanoarchaeota archaeon]